MVAGARSVIAQNELIGFRLDGRDRWFECRNVNDKRDGLQIHLLVAAAAPDRRELRQIVRDLAPGSSVDTVGFCRDLCMAWHEMAELAADPLVTIGVHTVNHLILSKVAETVVRAELGTAGP